MSVQFFAWTYAAFCLGIIGFQIALICGAPWGHITQGGQRRGALPPRNRKIAGVSALLMALMALSTLGRAGVFSLFPAWTVWGALIITLFSLIANTVTQSRAERRLWTPILSLMLVCILAVIYLT